VIEDRWIGRQPRDGELMDIAFKSPAVQQVSRDVVKAEALAQVVK